MIDYLYLCKRGRTGFGAPFFAPRGEFSLYYIRYYIYNRRRGRRKAVLQEFCKKLKKV